MIRTCVIALSLVALAGVARADLADDLQVAADHLQRADYQRAAQISGEIAQRSAALAPADRAEAWRIYGLALYFLDRRDEAEDALLAYLRLEPDAQLDPALVPPEAIRFFDEVRVRYAEEIAASRPKRKKIYPWLNLAPPFGQFQNDDRGKGWAVVATGTGLVAINVATFVTLREWCARPDDVCRTDGGADRTDAARALRVVNWVSLIGAVAVYAYGVQDGFRNMPDADAVEVSFGPGGVVVSGRF